MPWMLSPLSKVPDWQGYRRPRCRDWGDSQRCRRLHGRALQPRHRWADWVADNLHLHLFPLTFDQLNAKHILSAKWKVSTITYQDSISLDVSGTLQSRYCACRSVSAALWLVWCRWSTSSMVMASSPRWSRWSWWWWGKCQKRWLYDG